VVSYSVVVLLVLSGDEEVCYDTDSPAADGPEAARPTLSSTVHEAAAQPLPLPSLRSVCQSFQLAVAAEIDALNATSSAFKAAERWEYDPI